MDLRKRLDSIREKIEKSLIHSHRNFSDIQLIAVTKYSAIDQILLAYDLGLKTFGESRVEDALEKQQRLPKDVNWHLIGTLQRKKVAKTLGNFVMIHSIDSLDLLQKIDQKSFEIKIKPKVLIQVNLSKEESKHGFYEEDIFKNFEKLFSFDNVSIEGLMTMAPLSQDQSLIRKTFSNLRELKDKLNSLGLNLKELSMGMSQDYPIAIEEGATMIRLGGALFKNN